MEKNFKTIGEDTQNHASGQTGASPAPVRLALKLLDELPADRAEKLRKPFPAYAMTLARQGKDVNEQVLRAALTKGDDAIIGARVAFNKAAETIEQRYARIVKKLPALDNPNIRDNPSLALHTRIIRSAQRGDLAMLQEFIRQGADVRAGNDDALRSAAHNGHLEVVKLLLDKGADVRAGNDDALHSAAYNGHLEVVKFLLDKGANVRAENGDALRWAAYNGHLEVVKLLLDKGADVRAYNDAALRSAASYGHLEVVKFLLDKGADMAALSTEQRKELEPALKNIERWRKMTGDYPPAGLGDKQPGSFDPSALETISRLIKKEGYGIKHANRYAYNALAFFGTPEKIMDYFEKWAVPGTQPLHDAVQMISVPENAPDLASWASAVMQQGPEMAKLVKFADKIPQPLKSADGKTWSLAATRQEAAKFAYPKGKENPELAALFNRHEMDEEDFNDALDIVKKFKGKTQNRIPAITINGQSFGLPKASFQKLPDGDYRGLVLGQITDCCQSIGGAGEDCAKHGFGSENGGFYVVATNDNEIIGQSWAWRGTKGELVLDSLETLGKRVNADQWGKLAKEFAKALKGTDVTALHIGQGGGTPRNLPLETAKPVAEPKDYNGYRDSGRQYKVQ